MKGKLERSVFDFGEDRVECIELLMIIIVILVRLERDLYSHAMILSCRTIFYYYCDVLLSSRYCIFIVLFLLSFEQLSCYIIIKNSYLLYFY